jgi:DNA-binding IclR family transcriptional regulator
MDKLGERLTRFPQRSRGSQSICRAIDLLRYVAKRNENGARLSGIARDAGINVSTTHRILGILVKEGLVTYDQVSKHYHLGLELYNLGITAYQFEIRDRFRASLERIERETEDTVFLIIRSGNDALCVDRVEGRYPVRTVLVDIGSRRPLGIGAGSLSLIAFLPEAEFEAVVLANAPRYPPYKNLTADNIRQLAVKSRKVGYVVSYGLFHEKVISVGIPIFDKQQQVVAAITVSAISQRMDHERREEIYRLVKQITRAEGAV